MSGSYYVIIQCYDIYIGINRVHNNILVTLFYVINVVVLFVCVYVRVSKYGYVYCVCINEAGIKRITRIDINGINMHRSTLVVMLRLLNQTHNDRIIQHKCLFIFSLSSINMQ